MNIVVEIGINYAHGESRNFPKNARRLIDIAVVAGCTHVKFQLRNPEESVPRAQWDVPKTVPWRREPTTYLQYKKDIELSDFDLWNLFKYAQDRRVIPFASVCDVTSAKHLYSIAPGIVKIPSAYITDERLREACLAFDYRIMSTGMSTEHEIDEANYHLKPNMLMHTVSEYPCPVEELHMRRIEWMRGKYPGREIGYSHHGQGLSGIISAVPWVDWIEFHVAEDHRLWGSDQAASLEPQGVIKAVRAIRDMEAAWSKGNHERTVLPGELSKRGVLRG